MKQPLILTGVVGLGVLLAGLRTTDSLPSLSPFRADVKVAASPVKVDASPVKMEASPHAAATITPTVLTGVVRQYCVVCHNDPMRTGNLSLEKFDAAAPEGDPTIAEKMIVKLRAGMMPPPGMPRPAPDTLLALVETIEQSLDRAAAKQPNPGARSFQRLTRVEYERSIKALLGLDIDASDWLPLDAYLANFDNMAVAQTLSPDVLESFLNAANEVSRLAIGYQNPAPTSKTFTVPVYSSQHPWDHVEGAPEGTRGGVAVDYDFPADGEYVFNMAFWMGDVEALEDVDVSVDGEQVALVRLEILHRDAEGPRWEQRTEPVFLKSGVHRVAAAFIRTTDGLYDDIMQPSGLSSAGTRQPEDYGVTHLAHMRTLTVTGPYNARGTSETDVRRRIFTCRPVSAQEARPCAEQIITRLATQAYRRPLVARDMDALMGFFDEGAREGGFEVGIRSALEAILASPHFVFRIEEQPSSVKAGSAFELNDIDLASRLSFFIWGLPPDEELLRLAQAGELARPRVLEEQTRRMIADPRSEALATRFATQWLRLQDMDKVKPDAFWYPQFSSQIAAAMRSETQLFFYDLVRRDASLLTLFNADYTFLNERLAEHYGIEGVVGDEFRRVTYPEGMPRRGLLGQGSVLMLTSLGGRTSPVLRGKWVMEVLLGTPPPPPPANVPPLDQTAGATTGRIYTTRERMELHSKSPVCSSCHRFMDPIGLALDNFDVTGQWRIRENGAPLDTRGQLYDGTPVDNPAALTKALLSRPIPLVRNFTSNLLAYALGRRVEYFDQPTVRAIARDAEANGYRMSSFVLGVVKSPAFRERMAVGSGNSN